MLAVDKMETRSLGSAQCLWWGSAGVWPQFRGSLATPQWGKCVGSWWGEENTSLQRRLGFLLTVSACSLELAWMMWQGLPDSLSDGQGKYTFSFLGTWTCLYGEKKCCTVRSVAGINTTVFFFLNADFNSVSAASIFYELMLRLGFNEFYAQGGDWGWLICTNLAQIAPKWVPLWYSAAWLAHKAVLFFE